MFSCEGFYGNPEILRIYIYINLILVFCITQCHLYNQYRYVIPYGFKQANMATPLFSREMTSVRDAKDL